MAKQRKNRTAEQRKRLGLQKTAFPKKRDIFETGLEALEVSIAVIGVELTPTEATLFQVLLLNSDRDSGKIGKRKISDYAEITGRNEMSIYGALAELNEKGLIKTETNGWVRGEVLKRHKNKKKSAQQELPGMPLSRALVHRQALKLMIQFKLSAITQRLYWELATQIDTHTGMISERNIKSLAEKLKVKPPTIYKSIRQLNAAGLGNLVVDFGLTGHLPHVALAYGAIRLAVERLKEAEVNGASAKQKYERYRAALYRCFGVPIERLQESEITRAIAALKEKLDPHVSLPERKEYMDPYGVPYSPSPLRWTPQT